MAPSTKPRALVQLWQAAFEQRPNAVFHQVLSGNGSLGNTASVSGVLRNAVRLADGIRSSSKLKSGDRVAMLADGYGEVVPLYFAFWLLGIGVVAIPNNTAPEIAVAHINNSGCKGLVYSPSLAARLASIIPKVSGIEFWLLIGVGRTGPLGGGTTVTRLEDLLQSSSRNVKLEDFNSIRIPETSLSLVAFTSGELGEPRGVGFTEEALLAAAKNQASVYSIGNAAERFSSLLPDKHIVTLIHMLLVPLVSPLTSVVLPELQATTKPGLLVEELYDNQVHAVWMREDRLEELRAATKSQKFALSKNFKIFLVPRCPLPAKTLEGISNFIVPCFIQTESGGVLSVGTKGDLTTSTTSSVEKTPIVSGGSAIPGVKIDVVDSMGNSVQYGEIGELTVSSSQVMTSYVGSAPGNCFMSPVLALHTGDRVQSILSPDGKRHIVMVGREDQFITRGDNEVNLFELESVIRRVVGVKDVRVVGFTHSRYGKELGAFVLLQKKAQITREILWSNILPFFPWEIAPKVFMIADAALVPHMPSREEIAEKLSQFSNSDFSRPPKIA